MGTLSTRSAISPNVPQNNYFLSLNEIEDFQVAEQRLNIFQIKTNIYWRVSRRFKTIFRPRRPFSKFLIYVPQKVNERTVQNSIKFLFSKEKL